MEKTKQKEIRTCVAVGAVILAAYLCRIIGNAGILSRMVGFLRSFLYISLFLAWGSSLYSRIVHQQLRRLMTSIAGLMALWFVFRTVKFHFSVGLAPLSRYMWYLYYLPMLFIPLFALFVALSIGLPEDKRLNNKTKLLFIPAAVLFFAVITNDIHQLVFTFPPNAAAWTDSDYGYSFGYILIVVYLVFCAVAILRTLFKKCRLPGKSRSMVLPCLPIVCLLAYMILNYLRADWLYYIAGDMTAVFCLMYAATLELCIKYGFIQANTRYEELFSNAADIPAQITDGDYTVRFVSKDAERIPEKQMRAAEKEPIMLSDGKRLHNMPIHGGQVIWTEDMSELLNLQQELADMREELTDRNGLLQYEYEREKAHKLIEEQNRLYDLLQRSTQTQIDKISRLVSRYRKTEYPAEKKRLLSQITVLGSFVKRRKDMCLCIDSTSVMPESKLRGALEESLRSLKLMNVKGSCLVDTGKEYRQGELLALAYDFFEETAETALDSLRSIEVRVVSVKGKPRISIFADSDADFSPIKQNYPSALLTEDEDGTELVLLLEGGEP